MAKNLDNLNHDVEKLLTDNFFIQNSVAEKLLQNYKLTIDELLVFLLPFAAEFAKVPVSDFKVGAVVLSGSGNIYFGANMEFKTEALSSSIHAEQAAVNNAWLNGVSGIDKIAATAAPCGYCRQYLNELTTADKLKVILKQKNSGLQKVFKLNELLPEAFGPHDLNIEGGLMKSGNHNLKIENNNDELVNFAFEAANKSYAPYSKNYSGVALKLEDGAIFCGRYSENAAYNPSMSPLQSALAFINMNTQKGSEIKISDVVLAEAVSKISQRKSTETLLKSISGVELRYYKLSN